MCEYAIHPSPTCSWFTIASFRSPLALPYVVSIPTRARAYAQGYKPGNNTLSTQRAPNATDAITACRSPFTAFRQATPSATPTFLSPDFHEGIF